ncbi:hypothetical protein PR048_029355 [Dryococelus australis]|uniref:Uncharacterized protein n=1 Tax=Dryococelus australis TaxID=614101 RepID=A0ABQ9GD43_9NEOP|nr:hypothetical protein PR048_029355 [Dryococelus australis]
MQNYFTKTSSTIEQVTLPSNEFLSQLFLVQSEQFSYVVSNDFSSLLRSYWLLRIERSQARHRLHLIIEEKMGCCHSIIYYPTWCNRGPNPCWRRRTPRQDGRGRRAVVFTGHRRNAHALPCGVDDLPRPEVAQLAAAGRSHRTKTRSKRHVPPYSYFQRMGSSRRLVTLTLNCYYWLKESFTSCHKYSQPLRDVSSTHNTLQFSLLQKNDANFAREPGSIPGRFTPGFSQAGIAPGECRWSVGFLRDLPVPPPLNSSAAPYSPHFTLIGSQRLDVKIRPNLFTRSRFTDSVSLIIVFRLYCKVSSDVLSKGKQCDKKFVLRLGSQKKQTHVGEILPLQKTNNNRIILFPVYERSTAGVLAQESLDCERKPAVDDVLPIEILVSDRSESAFTFKCNDLRHYAFFRCGVDGWKLAAKGTGYQRLFTIETRFWQMDDTEINPLCNSVATNDTIYSACDYLRATHGPIRSNQTDPNQLANHRGRLYRRHDPAARDVSTNATVMAPTLSEIIRLHSRPGDRADGAIHWTIDGEKRRGSRDDLKNSKVRTTLAPDHRTPLILSADQPTHTTQLILPTPATWQNDSPTRVKAGAYFPKDFDEEKFYEDTFYKDRYDEENFDEDNFDKENFNVENFGEENFDEENFGLARTLALTRTLTGISSTNTLINKELLAVSAEMLCAFYRSFPLLLSLQHIAHGENLRKINFRKIKYLRKCVELNGNTDWQWLTSLRGRSLKDQTDEEVNNVLKITFALNQHHQLQFNDAHFSQSMDYAPYQPRHNKTFSFLFQPRFPYALQALPSHIRTAGSSTCTHRRWELVNAGGNRTTEMKVCILFLIHKFGFRNRNVVVEKCQKPAEFAIRNYFPSIVTNVTGRMPISAPVRMYAERGSLFSSKVNFKGAHFIVNSLNLGDLEKDFAYSLISNKINGNHVVYTNAIRRLLQRWFLKVVSNLTGATVAERLACSRPTKANRSVRVIGRTAAISDMSHSRPVLENEEFRRARIEEHAIMAVFIVRDTDKIDVKHVYTEVDFAIGSQLIRHALYDSEPIADLQGNK